MVEIDLIKRFEIFTNNISTIHKGILHLKNEVMKQFGLKGNHAMYLFYLLYHSEGLAASQLSELVGIDKAAVSRSLSELYQKGYIDYPDFHGGKKYNTPAGLTEKGKQTMLALQDIICAMVDQISLTNIEEDNRTIMYRSLRTIAANIMECVNREKE